MTRNEGRQALDLDEVPEAEGFLEPGGGGLPFPGKAAKEGKPSAVPFPFHERGDDGQRL